MKILYTTLQFTPIIGGTENVFKKYYDFFSLKYPVEVITTNLRYYKPDPSLLDLTDNIKRVAVQQNKKNTFSKIFYWQLYRRFYGQTLNLDLNFPKRFMTTINNTKFDLLHASTAGDTTSYWAMKIAKKFKKPFILTPAYHFHKNNYEPNLKERLSLFGQPNYKLKTILNSDFIMTYTESEKKYLLNLGVDKSKCHSIGTGINLNDYKKNKLENIKYKINFKPTDKIILFIGRRNKYKGLQPLINALDYCDKNIKLVIIGPKLDNFQIPKGRTNKIIDLGETSDNIKNQALELCDIFCLPSTRESFGLVYLEAWCYEKPVIAADTEISREIISNGTDGLLVKQKPEDIAQKINLLSADKNLRTEMGKNGRNKVSDKFTWEKILPRVENIYKDIYEQKNSHNIA